MPAPELLSFGERVNHTSIRGKPCGGPIADNSKDQPYWKIERNIFMANNYATSMGIALSGLTDASTIANNSFRANRVHIKLARGGNNTYVYDCDFLKCSHRYS